MKELLPATNARIAGVRLARELARALSVVTGALLLSSCSKPGPDAAAPGSQGSRNPTTAATATCALHQAPRELCFICDPALRDKDRLWCREHDRYEDRCWECHPEARDQNRPYCNEHGLYEDECFICHPEARPKSATQAETGHPHASLLCEEHGVAEAECGICHPDQVARLDPGQALKVRLPSPDSARAAGVELGKPTRGQIAEGVECYADITFNQNKVAQIVTPVSGILQEVPVDLGHTVEEKQPVARLWSASIAEAVAKAVLSHQTLDRERRLRGQRVTSQQNLEEAEAAHRAACQQLRTLGFTEEQIDALGHKPQEEVLLEMRAPFAGEIVERNAVRGAFVEAGRTLFTLADRSVMWAMLNLPESALGQVRVGQEVELQLDSMPGKTFAGTLTWVSAEVDDRTRMARARAEIPNPEGVLRAKMFAQARILTRTRKDALLLPGGAVQHVEGTHLVFVKLEEDLYEARRVQLGARFGGQVEVMAGLRPEENVALSHVFPLKSQLLVSRLGAGCAHEK